MSYLMIVLNGEPFIDYCLKAIYPFAHEIIIVEGAVGNCAKFANEEGESTDGTVELIKNYPDVEGKIKFIQGSWSNKLEMHNEGLKRVTGNYVWVVDVDEFYHKEDVEKIFRMLETTSEIREVRFRSLDFWKGLDYIISSQKLLMPLWDIRRIFKSYPGMYFIGHRPPELNDEVKGRVVGGKPLAARGIYLYHYGYLFEEQVRQKIDLNSKVEREAHPINLYMWYEKMFKKWTPQTRDDIEKILPVWPTDAKSKTAIFTGVHPHLILGMFREVKQGVAI